MWASVRYCKVETPNTSQAPSWGSPEVLRSYRCSPKGEQTWNLVCSTPEIAMKRKEAVQRMMFAGHGKMEGLSCLKAKKHSRGTGQANAWKT